VFLDDKPQGEVTEAPAKITKLSQAVRASIKMFPKQGACWDPANSIGPCALGGAAYVLGYRNSGDYVHPCAFLNQKLGLNLDLKPALCGLRSEVEKMNIYRHTTAGENRLEIADWLEARGL